MNTPSLAIQCPRCGAVVPSDAPGGLCPKCVLLGAATSTDGDGRGDPPSLETVRAAFPQLEVRQLIGQGGMGFVYSARQPSLDRNVALKLLPVASGSDPRFAERFAREGRLLARLNHPNIVAVYDFGQTDGFCYLIMELVDGVNLRQAMRAGRFTSREALALVPKICDALQYAHEQGVLHRDIKPENILLDARGRVKIADFGIAKLVGDQRGDVTLTASGARLGTPHYMAPEQVEKPSEVDHRADIYSLGVVFYELLTGELPLGRFAPPSAKAELDARVDEIVLRALAKERELRQQSAGEVKTQVEQLDSPGFAPASGRPQAGWGVPRDFEYKSPRTLFGLPLVHVVSGWDEKLGRSREARGILAVGPRAVGWLAFGGQARGIIAFGGAAFGVFAFGGFALGGVAIGGMAAGLLSFGGLAVALWLALGGLAVGWEAFGGLAVGHSALGGLAIGRLTNPGLDGWRRAVLEWMPWMWIPPFILSFLPIAVSIWASRLPVAKTGTPLPRPNPWGHRLFWLIVTIFALPLSAIIAGLLAPRLDSPWLAALIPFFAGAGLWLAAVGTRPKAASAQPRAQWNPWPKRIFILIVVVLLLPAALLVLGLIYPMLSRSSARRHLPPPVAQASYAAVEQRQGESDLTTIWRVSVPEPMTLSLQFRSDVQTISLLPAVGQNQPSGAITLKLASVDSGAKTQVTYAAARWAYEGEADPQRGEAQLSLPFVEAAGDAQSWGASGGSVAPGAPVLLAMVGNEPLVLTLEFPATPADGSTP